jgi:hypothetical protein
MTLGSNSASAIGHGPAQGKRSNVQSARRGANLSERIR